MKWVPASFSFVFRFAGAMVFAIALISCRSPLPPDVLLPPLEPQCVRARVPGTVAELRAAPGSRVQAGAWVATLRSPARLDDPAQLRKILKQREAALARARTAYLREKQRVEGGQTVDVNLPAKQAFETAKAERNAARAQLESTQREVERLRHYAPCAGRIVGPAAAVGDVVRPGTPLLYIQPDP